MPKCTLRTRVCRHEQAKLVLATRAHLSACHEVKKYPLSLRRVEVVMQRTMQPPVPASDNYQVDRAMVARAMKVEHIRVCRPVKGGNARRAFEFVGEITTAAGYAIEP